MQPDKLTTQTDPDCNHLRQSMAAPAYSAPGHRSEYRPAYHMLKPLLALFILICFSSVATAATDFLDEQPWTVEKVRKGDTLSNIFRRHGLSVKEAFHIARIEAAQPLLKIRPGDTLRLKKTRQGTLGLLQYQLGKFDVLNVGIDPDGDSYLVRTETREPEIRVNNAKAIIYRSLLEAASEANISTDIVFELVALFGWQVDFSTDVKVGDHFLVIYEELYLDDKKVDDGEIIAAELNVAGETLQAIRHIDENGTLRYFSPDGNALTGAFLRSPLKFAHITSNFSKNRLHPVTKKWRPHKGVDYGAPTGTPVMATGDGVVTKTRWDGGYGKTVIIRHGGVYDTLYAHLSRYGKNITPGKRVEQGDIIGYVGSTGLTTGPHLHYEFRIHGVHQNPATVDLPQSAPIEDKYRSGFEKNASVWAGELEYLNRIPLAQTKSNQ